MDRPDRIDILPDPVTLEGFTLVEEKKSKKTVRKPIKNNKKREGEKATPTTPTRAKALALPTTPTRAIAIALPLPTTPPLEQPILGKRKVEKSAEKPKREY